MSVTSSGVTVLGTVTTNKGKIPTQITFQLLWKPYEDLQTFTAPIQSGNYEVRLPNGEFFGVSVDWKSPDGASGTQNFVQPFGTTSGQNIGFCPFSWEDCS